MDEKCAICGKNVLPPDQTTVRSKGIQSLTQTSIERGDGLHDTWKNTKTPFIVHTTCRKNYTRKSSVESFKRKRDVPSCDPNAKATKLRSQTPAFNIKEDCLYCSNAICNDSKTPKTQQTPHSEVATVEYLQNVIIQANRRKDEWGVEVKMRIQVASDLVAEEGKYHRRCAQLFYLGRQLDSDVGSGQSGRPVDTVKNKAFEKLCHYIDDNEECQYSLPELVELIDGYLDGEDGYTTKHLKQKIQEHYANNVIVTSEHGKPTIFSFRDAGHAIIREKWDADHKESAPSDRNSIVDMAAAIIRDDIRTTIYNCSEYPDMNNMNDNVPESLNRFLHGVIKTNIDTSSCNERRCTAIAHSIISACRPRSFVSPILLAIAVYIHRKYASRELIDILSSLCFSDNYREVQRLNSAFLLVNEPTYNLSGFTQFVFDNADFNTATHTGHNTFHAMGGIACVTPAGEAMPRVLNRSTVTASAEHIGKFGQIAIKTYKKPTTLGLKSVIVDPLGPPKSYQLRLDLAKSLDSIWLSSFVLGPEVRQCPSWGGFMQMAVRDQNHERSRIEILPFINQDPSNPNTIYSALCFAQRLSEQYGLGTCPVTFDQPLYAKAAEIVEASPDLSLICVRLGGFHLLMSYMGSVGYIMAGSGLDALWETVYASNTVVHMLTGHAYARALRAHLLSSAAIISVLLDTPECMSGINLDKLRLLHEALLKGKSPATNVVDEECVQQMTHVIDKLMDDSATKSRTGKLWTSYVKHVSVIREFLRAERTGDWVLHLHCISEMIPLFHAAGHFAYAKSARLYLQQMTKLAESMYEKEYTQFTEKGYFTIRRTNHFWSGNFSDQTIEQELMRLLKTSGGMTRGRGITDSSLVKWVHALPHSIPICDSLEAFTGVRTNTSDQHKDLRASSTARDTNDYKTFRQWLCVHSPFAYSEHDSLVAISTGIVADKSANCDNAYKIGLAAASAITGKNFTDIKLSRKDRVTTISGARNTINVRGQDVDVNPTLLFLRITCVINDTSEMENYLCYELAKKPPSLFDKGLIRRTAKSALGALLKSEVEVHSNLPEHARFVLDGGQLLHTVPWPPRATYTQVCDAYITYTIEHYGVESTVVFDGYDSGMSTKIAEQQRRATQSVSADILFECDMKTTTTQKAFLANSKNKSRLIERLLAEFQCTGVHVEQHHADADYLIVSTAMTIARTERGPVVVVGTDTDLLIMLIAQASVDMDIYMLCHRNPLQVYNIREMQSAVCGIKQHLMFAHAITGCDTVSAPYMRGKRKALELLRNTEDLHYLDTFRNPSSTHENVAHVGEMFLLKLYGAIKSKSLDKYRYIMYTRTISRSSLSSAFKLESLPPTTAAAKYHSYRTYLTVQQWMGNDLPPTDWGWQYRDEILVPIDTDQPIAPERVLRIVSCGCKTGCQKACGCRKAGLYCSPMCSHCNGQTCNNTHAFAPQPESDDDQ